MSKSDKPIRKADSVQWMGLCPCGCGIHYALLMDEEERPIAAFGWNPKGWAHFIAGVALQVREGGDSMGGVAFENYTAH